jgi:2-oxo-4-hydroxy-4-carboxy-5-ureidoimidazoline decarboxylase
MSRDRDQPVAVPRFNVMPEAQAAELLASCCGSSRWVREMLARRPFRSRDQLLEAAVIVWGSLDPGDWREAFSHHPRIGERTGAVPQTARGAAWSAGEQAGMDSAGASLKHELAAVNLEYEARFGFVYIVCATGKTANQMLNLARTRLRHEAGMELATAAKEQEKIMRIRLETLFS